MGTLNPIIVAILYLVMAALSITTIIKFNKLNKKVKSDQLSEEERKKIDLQIRTITLINSLRLILLLFIPYIL